MPRRPMSPYAAVPHPDVDRELGRAADRDVMRAANLALVCATAFAADPPLSRAGLADTTRLSRPTVSRLADDLVRAGLLREGASPPAAGPGRPAIPLRPSGRTYAALGLQVNVGRLSARVVDLAGRIVDEHDLTGDFTGSDPNAVLPQLLRLGSSMAAQLGDRRLVGVGVALPGLVAENEGRLLVAPNLGWVDVTLGEVVSATFAGVPVSVENEAKAAALTVARHGPGRPSTLRDFLYLSGEVGIGGCIVADGRVVRGRHGWAGEFGHVAVDPHGSACRCGSTGCLETIAGRSALTRAAGLADFTTSAELAGAAEAGDSAALRVLQRAAEAVAVAVGSIINVLDIPTVVLGGHLAGLGEGFAAAVEARLAGRVLHHRWAPVTVRAGREDPCAGAVGAAYGQLERLIGDPASAGGWVTVV